jgi:hypothetical protein
MISKREAAVTTGYTPFVNFSVSDLDSTMMRLVLLGASLDGPVKYPVHGKVLLLLLLYVAHLLTSTSRIGCFFKGTGWSYDWLVRALNTNSRRAVKFLLPKQKQKTKNKKKQNKTQIIHLVQL